MNAGGAEGVLASSAPSLPADLSALIENARTAERLGNRKRARKRYEAAIRRLPRFGRRVRDLETSFREGARRCDAVGTATLTLVVGRSR